MNEEDLKNILDMYISTIDNLIKDANNGHRILVDFVVYDIISDKYKPYIIEDNGDTMVLDYDSKRVEIVRGYIFQSSILQILSEYNRNTAKETLPKKRYKVILTFEVEAENEYDAKDKALDEITGIYEEGWSCFSGELNIEEMKNGSNTSGCDVPHE